MGRGETDLVLPRDRIDHASGHHLLNRCRPAREAADGPEVAIHAFALTAVEPAETVPANDLLPHRERNRHWIRQQRLAKLLVGALPAGNATALQQPGDLVLIDEAGMASTRHLDWLTGYARERGAVVRLLGDPAQLNSVEAGGMLRLIAHDTHAVELTDLHRFTDPDEAAATLAIRNGDPAAVEGVIDWSLAA